MLSGTPLGVYAAPLGTCWRSREQTVRDTMQWRSAVPRLVETGLPKALNEAGAILGPHQWMVSLDPIYA
jgi:hypothetical protein